MKVLIIPILAALTQAASILFAKVGLTRRRISIKDYIPGLFLFLTVFAGLSLFKLGSFDSSALSALVLAKLLLLSVVAAVWNVLYYVGLSKEKVNTTEGIMILMPLATIILSWLFKPENFNGQIALAAVVSTLIVMWAYRSKNIFQPDKYSLMLGAAVVLIALENVLVSQVLQTNVVSPATLYAIRSFIVFVTLYIYYRPSLKKLHKSTLFFLAFSAIIGASTMLLRFYGLRDAGITLTAFVLILVPIIVFSSAIFFLHEKIKLHRIIAMVLVGAFILYATFVNYASLINK